MSNYLILKPVDVPPERRPYDFLFVDPTLEEYLRILPDPSSVDHVVIDFETKGVNPNKDDFMPVGFALAWKEKGSDAEYTSGYIHLTTTSSSYRSDYRPFIQALKPYRLVAHNVTFDGLVAYCILDQHDHLDWKYCTYGLFRQLASEGYENQWWSLETAQIDLLKWPDSNKWDLEKWLIDRGHYVLRGKKKKEIVADKSQMWQAPPEVMGPYSAQDALSTLQFLDLVLLPALERIPSWLAEYHQEVFLVEVKLLIEQQMIGMSLDVPAMAKYKEELDQQIQEVTDKFLSLPSVAPHLIKYNDAQVKAVEAEEPPKFIKGGKIASRWEKWRQKVVLTKSTNWFNPQSNNHLRWLFYTSMNLPIKVWTSEDEAKRQPSVNHKACLGFGEAGMLLRERQVLSKERGYVEAALDFVSDKGLMHLQFKAPGTLTGRLSGKGGVNAQQLSKTKEFLSPWRAREGHVWVRSDVSALEPRVLTELSEDETMMKLYGPGAKPNDIYLFNGAHISVFADKILKTGYDPLNPTAEAIKKAKKECKHERHILKTVTLAKNYNAGPGKIYQELSLEEIEIDFEEVREICREYNALYPGIKRLARQLEREWHDRGGWVYSGLAMPIPVAPDKTKDLVNRVVQSTGHHILQVFIRILHDIRQEEGLVGYPILLDLHDETIWECPEDQGVAWVSAFEEAYRRLNEWLGGKVPIIGEISLAKTMWDVKKE